MRATHMILAAMLLVAVCMTPVAAQDTKGTQNFHEAGFPTMALFTAVGLFCGAVYLGLTRGEGDAKGSASMLGPLFLSLCVVDFVIGIFFLFGPGGVLGARVNTLGLHLIVIAALGVYVGYTNQRTHAKILAALVAVTIFALCGCFPLLNHGEPIWSLSSSECLSYFFQNADNFNRCKDTGYLQLLRTFGLFVLASLLVQSFQLLETLSGGEVLTHRSPTARGAGAGAHDPLLPGFGEQPVYNPPMTGVLPSSASSSTLGGGPGAAHHAPASSQAHAGAAGDNTTMPQGSSYQSL